MKIFSASQIREWDQYTIAHEPISSHGLMERAAQQCTDWLIKKELEQNPIRIFCGKGNNGGDGLAIARQLSEQGISSRIYILEFGAPGTEDFQTNLRLLHQFTKDIHFVQDVSFFPVIKKEDVVIDALFGTGLNRALEGMTAELVHHINSAKATVISVDVPSGMFTDNSSLGFPVIKASHTLTFQVLKLCFLMPENEDFIGEAEVLDIGLAQQFIEVNETAFNLIDKELVAAIYKRRKKFSHKGTFGHALIMAGSRGKTGAAYLASKACLRSGAGLLTSIVPSECIDILQTSLPEAMCMSLEELELLDVTKFQAVGVGPGLGTARVQEFKHLLTNYNKPTVIDADALNVLSENIDLLKLLPEGSILTPHPKEFERLFGVSANSFDRMLSAINNATLRKCYIVLKGHYTFTACPDGKGYFNSTGNPGMATAGSGDVLTGVLTGLLSQGYSSLHTCILGTYLHGLAGDLAAVIISEEAMIAGDIINYIGNAFLELQVKDLH